MKTRRLFLLFIWFVVLTLPGCNRIRSVDPSIRVMTFNIRRDHPDDGPDAWPFRKDQAASMIRFHRADLIGIQEGFIEQVDDLAERLPDFSWYGIGRDDGLEGGEIMAIFYRSDRFEILDQGTFWLSETPNQPGLGWDAVCNRVVTWARFHDRSSGKTFVHFNTHFDHRGEQARLNSALMLLKSVHETGGDLPVVVTGDFNAFPHDAPIQRILQGLEEESQSGLIDTKTVSIEPHHGPNGTITRFQSAHIQDQPIDYIFIRGDIKVLRHGTLSDSFDGRFPSDHMPVLAEIIIGS
ncbi:endonuclease/exonuclease/phosphatase family protein [candidate division KSB1 bacterium]|nr:endonuclease/exonuclease/phosphatase family protein [candidate division KSB1 bacterium]